MKPEKNADLPKKIDIDAKMSSAERARLLLGLIGQSSGTPALDELRSKAERLSSNMSERNTSPETVKREARKLLEAVQKRKARKTHLPSLEVVRSTIAALVETSNLEEEHPAVLAVVLQKQDRATKASVMRSTHGDRARRIQAALTSLRKQRG